MELLNAHMAEMERRTAIEHEAEKLICQGKNEEAIEMLHSIDDSIIQGISKELDEVNEAARKIDMRARLAKYATCELVRD